MSVKKLAEWFWGEILNRPMENCYSKPGFKICLRHAKLLLRDDGLDENAIRRTLLTMKDMGKEIKAMTIVRWEYKSGSGTSFYTLVAGGAESVPCYDTFGQLMNIR